MTPNELEQIQKAFKWAREPNCKRSTKIETGNNEYGWVGYEDSFRIFCWDYEIKSGFIIMDIEDEFLTTEQMLDIKKQKLEEELREV